MTLARRRRRPAEFGRRPRQRRVGGGELRRVERERLARPAGRRPPAEEPSTFASSAAIAAPARARRGERAAPTVADERPRASVCVDAAEVADERAAVGRAAEDVERCGRRHQLDRLRALALALALGHRRVSDAAAAAAAALAGLTAVGAAGAVVAAARVGRRLVPGTKAAQ